MSYVAVNAVLLDWPDDECASLERARRIASRVIHEAKKAVHSWAVLSNFQRRYNEDSKLSARLLVENPSGLSEILDALYLSSILAFMRMTDDAQSDLHTACGLVRHLNNESVRRAVTDTRWLKAIERELSWVELPATSHAQFERINWVLTRVPNGWGKHCVEPSCPDLVNARKKLLDLRHSRIAHAKSMRPGLDWPSVQEMGAIMRFATELSNRLRAIFLVDSGTWLPLPGKLEPKLGAVWNDLFDGVRRRHGVGEVE